MSKKSLLWQILAVALVSIAILATLHVMFFVALVSGIVFLLFALFYVLFYKKPVESNDNSNFADVDVNSYSKTSYKNSSSGEYTWEGVKDFSFHKRFEDIPTKEQLQEIKRPYHKQEAAKKVLGIDTSLEDLSLAELKSAFKRRAKQSHPDLCDNDENAKSEMQKINEAYALLKQFIKENKGV